MAIFMAVMMAFSTPASTIAASDDSDVIMNDEEALVINDAAEETLEDVVDSIIEIENEPGDLTEVETETSSEAEEVRTQSEVETEASESETDDLEIESLNDLSEESLVEIADTEECADPYLINEEEESAIYAEESESEDKSAETENITYDIISSDSGSILILFGTGKMDDYDPSMGNAAPWSKDAASIQHIIVSDGITSIGRNAFAGAVNFVSVFISESVELIDDSAFEETADFIVYGSEDSYVQIWATSNERAFQSEYFQTVTVNGQAKEIYDKTEAEDLDSGISIASESSESSLSYNDCYGNQLTDTSKFFYDLLVSEYVTNGNTAAFTYTFNSDSYIYFNAEVENGELVQNETYYTAINYMSSAFLAAYEAFELDYPEVFWISRGCDSYTIRYSSTVAYFQSVSFTPYYLYDGATSQIAAYNSAVSNAVSTIKSNISGTTTRYKLVKAIHDYVCENAYYDSSDQETCYSSAGFFLGDGGIVCQGYAMTFKVLCDQFSIPCACIEGIGYDAYSYGTHMWNYVQMEDHKWYMIDTTWDDGEMIDYTYLLAGAQTIGYTSTAGAEHYEEHYFDSCKTQYFYYPTLNAEAYEEPESVKTAALYTEKGNTNTRIDTLNYAAGSFSWYYSDSDIDVTDWNTSDFDMLYCALVFSCEDASLENLSVTVTLPDGLSFSDTSVVSETDIQLDYLSDSEQLVWLDEPVYLLYCDDYEDAATLEITCEWSALIQESYIEVQGEESADLVSLNMISAPSDVTLIRDDDESVTYTWDAEMFTQDTTKYNKALAEFSAYMSDMIEGSDKDKLQERLRFDLLQLGFSKIQYSGAIDSGDWSNPGLEEESVCAEKKIIDEDGNVKTVILYAIQGSDVDFSSTAAWNDWIGNLSYTGLSDYHENFRLCAWNNEYTLTEYCSETGYATEDDSIRLLITGHSRGGAIANLVAYNLITETNSLSNLSCYTFAAPNVDSIDIPRAYSCIYNIVNYMDLVPFVPGNGLTKYGITLIFNEDNNVAVPAIVFLRGVSLSAVSQNELHCIEKTFIGFVYAIQQCIIDNHDMSNYIDAVKNDNLSDTYISTCEVLDSINNELNNLSNFIDWGLFIGSGGVLSRNSVYRQLTIFTNRYVKHIIQCPVDVEVRNSEGEIVCSIVNDELISCSVDDIVIMINGSTKEIWYEYDSEYSVCISGYDNGVMDYSVVSVNDDGVEDIVYTFDDVPVTISETTLTAEVDSDTGSIVFRDANNEIIEPDQKYSGDEITKITVELSLEDDSVIASGEGDYVVGDYVIVSAVSVSGDRTFAGWYDADGNMVSNEQSYGFAAVSDISLTPVFYCADADHQWSSEFTVTVPSTCTIDGGCSYICTICGAEKTEVIQAAGHKIVTDAAVAATCTTTGLAEGSHCSVCGAVIEEQTVTEATGHTVVTDAAVAATCTTSGLTEGSHCSVCGTIIVEQAVTEMTGHNYLSTVTKEATCTETGIRTITCTECGDCYTEVIKATGHTVVTDAAVEATCTTTGLTEGSHCSTCGAVIAAQITIPTNGHSWEEPTLVSEATVTSPATCSHICASCGAEEIYMEGDTLTPFIELNANSLTLKKGQTTKKLTVTVANGDSVVSVKSNKTKYVTASLTSSGVIKIKGKNIGKARITITLASGLTRIIVVKVQKTAVKTTKITGLTKKFTLSTGNNLTLNPVITPITSLQKVTYRTSNKAVASVTPKGVITAKKKGTAKITVKSGSKKYVITVKVTG